MKRVPLLGALSLLLLVLLAGGAAALINDYQSLRMNFPPGESRSHLQRINYTGLNLSVTIPSGFAAANVTGGGSIIGSAINWSAGTNASVNYTLVSPSNCTEAQIFLSNISLNGTLNASFVFVCVPDNKIVDYKAEYGHGDANYLTDLFIPNDTATLFNLIRIFPLGHYLTPNEDAVNVTINCTFPRNFTVRTYGRVDVSYNDTRIKGDFLWPLIEEGYWFRIGVLSQDLTPAGLPIGSMYNLSCSDATFLYGHTRVVAPFTNISIPVRTKLPFNITVESLGDRLAYNITNIEQYLVKNIVFEWQTQGSHLLREYEGLRPGEMVRYEVAALGTDNISLNAYFTPSWFVNSLKPQRLNQSIVTAYTATPGPGFITEIGTASATLRVLATGAVYVLNDTIVADAMYFQGNYPSNNAACEISIMDRQLVTIVSNASMTQTNISGLPHFIFRETNWSNRTGVGNESGRFVGHVRCQRQSGGDPVVSTLVDFSVLDIARTINFSSNSSSSSSGFTSIEVIDVAILPMNKTYRAKIILHSTTGTPMNASTIPYLTIYDPNRTIIVNQSNMTQDSTGIYIFNTTFNFSNLAGLWETVFFVNISGEVRQTADFWTLTASPALVRIISLPDTEVPNVTCEYAVQNEGGSGQEYQITTCLNTANASCSSGIFLETFAKYIEATETFTENRTFPLNTTGTYFCCAEADFGGQVSRACREFTATNATAPPPPGPPGGGGGGGGGGGRGGPRVSPNVTIITPPTPPISFPTPPIEEEPIIEEPRPVPPPGTLIMGPLAIPPISFLLFLQIGIPLLIITLFYLIFPDEIEWLLCVLWCRFAHRSERHSGERHQGVWHTHKRTVKNKCWCHCCYVHECRKGRRMEKRQAQR